MHPCLVESAQGPDCDVNKTVRALTQMCVLELGRATVRPSAPDLLLDTRYVIWPIISDVFQIDTMAIFSL